VEASTLGTPPKGIIILLHAVHDCPAGRTAFIARHVSFSQITCYHCLTVLRFEQQLLLTKTLNAN